MKTDLLFVFIYSSRNLLACHRVRMICNNKKTIAILFLIMHNRLPWPQTINDAAERIIAIMNEHERTKVRAISEDKLKKLCFSLGVYVRHELGLFEGNDALIKACAISEHGDFESFHFLNDPDTASGVILEAIWNRLHTLTPNR